MHPAGEYGILIPNTAKGHLLAETKRQNFNITPKQEMELAPLRETLDAPSAKDAILRAALCP